VTIGGKCLDVADGTATDGAAVDLLGCTGEAAQSFTWASDGSLQVLGKCVEVSDGSNATGALLQLADCAADAPEQHFSTLPDGTIYAAKSAKCVAVQGAVAAAARVGLAPCDPAEPAQQFTAASAPAPAYVLHSGPAVSYSNPDDTPASPYLDKDGSFYYQQAHALYGASDSRRWSFYQGKNFDDATVADQTQQPDNADTTRRCNTSPTGVEATPSSGYPMPNYCDLSGVWVDPDTGDWYGLVHNEFTGQPFGDGLHYDGIDYAVSTDQGNTWTIKGHAITSPFSTERGDTSAFPHETYYYGDGDQRLFADYASGYFYAFYATRVVTKAGGGNVWLEHVARAPISGKMKTGTWTKWYNGTWSQPGVGGAESNIIPSDGDGTGYTTPSDDYAPENRGTARAQVAAGTLPDNSQLAVMNIAWSAYLGKYIATPQNNVAQATNTKTPLHFYTTDDLATQKWTDMGLAGADNAAWYRWMLDPGNLTSSSVVGRTFRSYCSFYCSRYTGEYVDVTIDPSSSSALPAGPVRDGGSYQIKATNGQYVAQRDAGLITTPTPSTGAAEQWIFEATGDGFFSVANAESGQLLGVDATSNSGRAWGAPVTLSAKGAELTAGQQWSVQTVVDAPETGGASVPTGSYRLINRYSGQALSLTESDRAAVDGKKCNGIGNPACIGNGTCKSQHNPNCTGERTPAPIYLPTPGAVETAPQRGWTNQGTAGDTRPVAAQLLDFAGDASTVNTVSVSSPGPQTSQFGSAITPLDLQAADSDPTQTLRWSATGLPEGLTIDQENGRITGSPTAAGSTVVTVTATDATGASGWATFTYTVSRADLALGKPTTASSLEVASLAAGNATDGDPTTRWASGYSDDQWLQVDLGAVAKVEAVHLSWESAYATGFKIQMSDDTQDWTTIYSTSTGSGGEQDLTGLSGTGRYIRLLGTKRATGYGYSLYTFAVYGSTNAGPRSLTMDRPTTASSVEPGSHFTPELATDGDPATRWASGYSDDEWLQVDMGSVQSVSAVTLVWEAAYATGFRIQVSDDARDWSTIYATTTGTGGTQHLTGLTGSGRYIRMLGTARATGYGYSLFSFDAYA